MTGCAFNLCPLMAIARATEISLVNSTYAIPLERLELRSDIIRTSSTYIRYIAIVCYVRKCSKLSPNKSRYQLIQCYTRCKHITTHLSDFKKEVLYISLTGVCSHLHNHDSPAVPLSCVRSWFRQYGSAWSNKKYIQKTHILYNVQVKLTNFGVTILRSSRIALSFSKERLTGDLEATRGMWYLSLGL